MVALALAAVYLIWSSTYLALGVAVQDLPPFGLASLRFLIAGALMFAWARARGAPLPTRREWLAAVPVGVLLFVGGNGFVTFAERSVPSGGAAVVCATMPLWLAVFAALGGTRPSAREWASLALGFAGVVVLVGGPSLAGAPADVALLLVSPICWAGGSVFARRAPGPKDAVMAPAIQMLVGGVALAIVSTARGEPLPIHAGAKAWGAIAYLIVFGSIAGFTAYGWLLRNARPAVATSYAFVNPLIAVVIGAALHGEPLGAGTVVANALIAVAVMLAVLKPGRARAPRATAPAVPACQSNVSRAPSTP